MSAIHYPLPGLRAQGRFSHLISSLPAARDCVPLLLLWAEKDQFQPLASAERFYQEYPQSELRVILDSDHFLPLEKGPEVARILLGYLMGVQINWKKQPS